MCLSVRKKVSQMQRSCSSRQKQTLVGGVDWMLRALRARRSLIAAITIATAPASALQLHVKAGPDGRSIGDCPFAHAVRLAAGAKGLPVDVHPHAPDAKPAWLLDNHEGKMPCLVDGADIITESRRIAAFLDERYPPSLSGLPGIEAAEAAAQPVFGAFARYCKSCKEGSLTAENVAAESELKKALLLHLCTLDAHLAVAAKPYACGEAFSTADAFLLPALYHIKVAGKAFKGFEIPVQFMALHAYMEHAMATSLFTESAPTPEMVRWGWATARTDDSDHKARVRRTALAAVQTKSV
jgi:glutathione S-transferase